MNYVSSDAIVLGRIEYGEADRILTLITSSEGKLSVLAKGVRRPKSKLAGGLELFSVSTVQFIKGRGDLKTLVSAHLKEHFGVIVKNIERTMTAYDCLKQVNRFTETDCEPDYFKLLHESLKALNTTAVPLAVVQLWFAMRLLQLSGHGINLTTSASGDLLTAEESYKFDVAGMSFVPAESGEFSGNHIKFLRLALAVGPQQLARVGGAEKLAEGFRTSVEQAVAFYGP